MKEPTRLVSLQQFQAALQEVTAWSFRVSLG